MAFRPLDGESEISAPATEEAGLSDYAMREAGLLARAAINPTTVGAAGGAILGTPLRVPGMGAKAGAAAGFLTDIGARVYNAIVAENTGMGKLPVLSEVLEDVKNNIGLPKPSGAFETMQERAVESASGLVPIMSGGKIIADVAKSPFLKEIGKALYASPRTQAASAMTGGMAVGLAEDADLPAPVQAAAGIAGSVVPGSVSRMAQVARTGRELGLGKVGALALAPAGITESSRGATIRILRGGKTPEQIAQTVQEYKAAGTSPSAGQATRSPELQQMETTFGKFPSGAMKFREKALEQQAEVGGRVEQIRAELSGVKEPVLAGRGASQSYKNIFLPTARKVQSELYNKADKLFPQGRVTVGNTESVLGELAKRFEQSPEMRNIFANKKILAIQKALRASKNEEGMIPFQTLRDFRTEVGEQLANVGPVPDKIAQSQYKALYKSITKDIDNAVAPYEPARNAYNRANRYTRAFHDRVENVGDILTQNNGEDVYKSIISGSKDGPSKLRQLLRTVEKDDQKAIVSTFVARMGRALPGAQDETGEIFSTSRFLTNYASLDPLARKEMFGRFGSEFQKNMDNIAKVSSMIRESSQIMANPSGTSGAVVGPATIASLEGSLAAGKFGFAAGVLGVLLQADQAARLMTSPKYVNWLASNLNTPISSSAAALSALANINKKDNNPDINAFLEEVEEQSK